MAPQLRERAPTTEKLGMLPQETVEEFKQAGFIRMLQPANFGGMGHDFETLVDVSIEIARGCGASGWLSSFMPVHNFMVSWFSKEAQSEYWADGPDTLSSTIPAYRSMTREEVSGGLKISGRASFSSGVDHAEWGLLHTTEEICLVPRNDFQIIEDWNVSGLRGTGSKSVTFEDVFVPAHRIVSNASLANGTHPGATLSENPWLKVHQPAIYVLNHAILAPVIGMARGVLDIFDQRARNRLDAQTFLPAIERPGPQLRFAEASCEIDAAEMFLRRNLSVLRASAEAGGGMALEERALMRRNIVYATKLSLQATNRLVEGMDSSALYEKNPLHRQARDVRAAALQFVLHWEETAIQYARVHWGLPPHTPII
jgi:alkylation response protein AidB-like acyl-CoA dehydrogenase